MSKKTAYTILTLIVLAIIIVLFFVFGGAKFFKSNNDQSQSEQTDAEFESASGLYINEIVSKSRSSLVMSDGSSPDWVEIYNGTSKAVSLSGISLSDDAGASKYVFPGISIDSGEYLVVLLTGEEGKNDDGYLTAGLRLNSDKAGELSLLDAAGRQIQTVEIPALAPDISYGRSDNGSYKFFAKATPGNKNSEYCSETIEFKDIKILPDSLVINEYQYDNKGMLRDTDGEYFEWVEIKNISHESIDLSGYGLSDKMTDIGRWSFEQTVLEPGECIVVFLSGKDRKSDELHADFRIGSNDNVIVLTDVMGGVLDVAFIDREVSGASVGRSCDDVATWLKYPSPTPGKDNTTKGFDAL